MKTEDKNEQGVIWAPYTTRNVSTDINGELVWHSNKFINFLLKVKRFFIKPKYLKNTGLYKKKIDSSGYGILKIDGKI
jgi:hypothetical protein